MPTYNFRDKESGTVVEKFMTISEMDDYLKKNSTLELVPASPSIISGRSGAYKPDDTFRDMLRTMKKTNKGSNINTFD